MNCVEIVDIVAIVVAIVVVLVASISQIYITKRAKDFETRRNARDEKRHNDEIYAEATRFIQKYSYKYKYNHVYPYRREVYREFCGLPEDVQNEIIKRLDLYIRRYEPTETYYTDILKRIMDAIQK